MIAWSCQVPTCANTLSLCPVDCVWSRWSCSQSCGWGTQTYNITTAAANNWTACSATQWQSQACNIQGCAGNWSCGSASGAILSSIPTTNLCSAWSASFITYINSQYIWTCQWPNWWISMSCMAFSFPVCDSINAGLCTIGNPSSDTAASCGTRTWNCTNVWQTASCVKSLPICIVLSSITWNIYVSGTNTIISWIQLQLYSWAILSSNFISSFVSTNTWYMFTWIVNGNYLIWLTNLPIWYDGILISNMLNIIGNSHLSYDFNLTHCGAINEKPCTQNNCVNPVCVNGCDAWFVLVWGYCVSPVGQLLITKTSISSGTIWSDIYYKLSIQNNKNIAVSNIMVVDYLPANLIYVSSQPNSIINWNLIYRTDINLAPWATGEYIIRTTINNTVTGNVTNVWYIWIGTNISNFITWWTSINTTNITIKNSIWWLIYLSWTNTAITWVYVSLYSGFTIMSWYISNTTGYLFTGLNNANYQISIAVPAWYTGNAVENLSLIWSVSYMYNFPLTRCGTSNQAACATNNCSIIPCNMWCDAWYSNINGICTKIIIPTWWWGWWWYNPKYIYCRASTEIYLYPSEIQSWDIAWNCADSTYITICRNGQNIKALKDYQYIKWFVISGDTMWECIIKKLFDKPKILDLKKYLDLSKQTNSLVLSNIIKNQTSMPNTGINPGQAFEFR